MTHTTTAGPLKRHHDDRCEQSASVSFLDEKATWLSTQRRSRRIYGDLEDEGVVIEWHNFELDASSAFDWSRGLSSDSLELCLNLAGHGFLQSAESKLSFGPLTAFLYARGNHELHAYRNHGERHRFLSINFSSRFLRDQLMVCEGALCALVRDFAPSGSPATCVGKPVRLTAEHEHLISLLLRPQCSQDACQLRCKGIVLQLMAEFLIEPCCGNQSSCDRQKRLAKERVRNVIGILQRDLADPPTLEEIAREVGSSPFYLSRTFSRETGMTIPQCLRTLRMRYAAELLKSGRWNVTEAAMVVGYSSLSHFSHAFCQTIGCCPAVYSSHVTAQAAATCAVSDPGAQQKHPAHNLQSDSQIDVFLESIC
jgi:AraC-like DNA-binding protein